VGKGQKRGSEKRQRSWDTEETIPKYKGAQQGGRSVVSRDCPGKDAGRREPSMNFLEERYFPAFGAETHELIGGKEDQKSTRKTKEIEQRT